MISDFKGKTAVLTGAGSGFGLECARIGARLGMNLVLADVQQDALDKAAAEMTAAGAQVLDVGIGTGLVAREALTLMHERRIGALVALGPQGEVVGVGQLLNGSDAPAVIVSDEELDAEVEPELA